MKNGWVHLFLVSCACWASWAVVGPTGVSTTPAAPGQTARGIPLEAASPAQTATAAPRATPALPSKAFVDRYCATCHNQRLKTAGLVFDVLDVTNVAADAPAWEKVVVK